MTAGTTDSPWTKVVACVESDFDALALLKLWSAQKQGLLANGRPLSDLFGGKQATDAGLSELLASHMRQLFASQQGSYAFIYSAAQARDVSSQETSRFAGKCRQKGVTLTDGATPLA